MTDDFGHLFYRQEKYGLTGDCQHISHDRSRFYTFERNSTQSIALNKRERNISVVYLILSALEGTGARKKTPDSDTKGVCHQLVTNVQ
jgi:hypothetical protein